MVLEEALPVVEEEEAAAVVEEDAAAAVGGAVPVGTLGPLVNAVLTSTPEPVIAVPLQSLMILGNEHPFTYHPHAVQEILLVFA